MATKVDVSIIIPVHGKWDLTSQCLTHLRASLTPGENVEVIVVDNASADQTRTECEPLGASLFGGAFRYERSEENMNFSGGCNRGAAIARAGMLFFLNNDTRACAGWLAPLLRRFAEDAGLGAASPLLLYPATGRVQHMGVAFNPANRIEHLYEYFPAGHPAVRPPRSFQALSAAALMVDRDLFFEVGGFHEEYCNGFEDLDLSFSIRTAGRTLTVVPESVIEHFAMQTPGRLEKNAANEALLRERWPDFARPDLHAFVAHDGFELRVTPWLRAYAALTPAREREVEREYEDAVRRRDANRLWHAIRREPLWAAGYEHLARTLRERGHLDSALDVRMLQCTFAPSLRALDALRRLAGDAGREEVARTATKHAAHARSRLADAQWLRDEATRIARKLAGCGETELARRYGDALKQGLSMVRESIRA